MAGEKAELDAEEARIEALGAGAEKDAARKRWLEGKAALRAREAALAEGGPGAVRVQLAGETAALEKEQAAIEALPAGAERDAAKKEAAERAAALKVRHAVLAAAAAQSDEGDASDDDAAFEKRMDSVVREIGGRGMHQLPTWHVSR